MGLTWSERMVALMQKSKGLASSVSVKEADKQKEPSIVTEAPVKAAEVAVEQPAPEAETDSVIPGKGKKRKSFTEE